MNLVVNFDGDGNLDMVARALTLQVRQPVSGQVAVAVAVNVQVHDQVKVFVNAL